jgi:hypothetical protein
MFSGFLGAVFRVVVVNCFQGCYGSFALTFHKMPTGVTKGDRLAAGGESSGDSFSGMVFTLPANLRDGRPMSVAVTRGDRKPLVIAAIQAAGSARAPEFRVVLAVPFFKRSGGATSTTVPTPELRARTLDDVEKLFEHAELKGEFNSRFASETLNGSGAHTVTEILHGHGDFLRVIEISGRKGSLRIVFYNYALYEEFAKSQASLGPLHRKVRNLLGGSPEGEERRGEEGGGDDPWICVSTFLESGLSSYLALPFFVFRDLPTDRGRLDLGSFATQKVIGGSMTWQDAARLAHSETPGTEADGKTVAAVPVAVDFGDNNPALSAFRAVSKVLKFGEQNKGPVGVGSVLMPLDRDTPWTRSSTGNVERIQTWVAQQKDAGKRVMLIAAPPTGPMGSMSKPVEVPAEGKLSGWSFLMMGPEPEGWAGGRTDVMHSAQPIEFEDIHLLGGIDFVVSLGGAGTVVVVAAQAIPQAVVPSVCQGGDKRQNNLDLQEWDVAPSPKVWMSGEVASLTLLVRHLGDDQLREYKNSAETLSREIMREDNNFVNTAIRWAREIRSYKRDEHDKIIQDTEAA